MLKIGNAAGWLKTPQDVDEVLRVPGDVMSFITLGSYTLQPRDGNPGNTFWDNGETCPTSLNALGLPNPGIAALERFFPELAKKIRDSGKRVRVSIAGFNPEEYYELADRVAALGPDEIEWNFGCPNIRKDGKQKPILAFDLEALATCLDHTPCSSGAPGKPVTAIKLSPYSDPFFLAKVADVLNNHLRGQTNIIISNTFPNGLAYKEEGAPVIDANDGYAGLAGYAMKHVALGQVRQFRKLLKPCKITGVGGVSRGIHVRDFELAGANEVQVGTAFFLRGPKVFTEIAAGYPEA